MSDEHQRQEWQATDVAKCVSTGHTCDFVKWHRGLGVQRNQGMTALQRKLMTTCNFDGTASYLMICCQHFRFRVNVGASALSPHDDAILRRSKSTQYGTESPDRKEEHNSHTLAHSKCFKRTNL